VSFPAPAAAAGRGLFGFFSPAFGLKKLLFYRYLYILNKIKLYYCFRIIMQLELHKMNFQESISAEKQQKRG